MCDDCPEPDLDTLTRAQLAELDPMYHTVACVLDDWNLSQHGVMSSNHGVGAFLELLAAEGYRVTPIPSADIDALVPSPRE